MNLYDLMEKRRSNRSFSNRVFPKEKLNKILKAGYFSPSGADLKPFVYIIIENPDLKKHIKDECEKIDRVFYKKSDQEFKEFMKEKDISLKKDFLITAPYIVAIFGEKDKAYWLESTWLSIAYIILAAENEGISTLTYTPANFDFLKDIIKTPENLEPVCIIPFGYKKSKK